MHMCGSYYHTILYRDFEGFYFCGGILFVTIRIRGLVCEQIQERKSYKQSKLTFVWPRPATDLRSFGTGSGDGKAGRQMPSNQGDGLGNVSTTSSTLLPELLFWEKVVLSGLKIPYFASSTVKTGESTWEHVSFQIKE